MNKFYFSLLSLFALTGSAIAQNKTQPKADTLKQLKTVYRKRLPYRAAFARRAGLR
jgi:hypothetical protein